MSMSKGGARPNSGRKKGSIPWNKGVSMSEGTKQKVSDAKKGTIAWNKGLKQPEVSERMKGNQNGKGGKGKIISAETRLKMRLARLGKPSPRKGVKISYEKRLAMSIARREAFNRESGYSYDPKNILRRDRKQVRRERLKKQKGVHSKSEWELKKEEYNFTCPSCKKSEPEIKLTRDHILSLSNGGSDDISNIQPLCVSCNSRKATKTIRY